MTILLAVLGVSLGYFVGVCATTTGLRRRLDEMEFRDRELARAEAQLGHDRRSHMELVESILKLHNLTFPKAPPRREFVQ